jgi:hypothetical protein
VYFVAGGYFAAFDDAREHPASSIQLGLQARADLVHPGARIADHRDLEQRLADVHLLTDRPIVDIGTLDREVLPNLPVVDPERVEVLRRGEEHLALRSRTRVSTALQTVTLERPNAFARVHAAAALRRRGPQTSYTHHSNDSTGAVGGAVGSTRRGRLRP